MDRPLDAPLPPEYGFLTTFSDELVTKILLLVITLGIKVANIGSVSRTFRQMFITAFLEHIGLHCGVMYLDSPLDAWIINAIADHIKVLLIHDTLINLHGFRQGNLVVKTVHLHRFHLADYINAYGSVTFPIMGISTLILTKTRLALGDISHVPLAFNGLKALFLVMDAFANGYSNAQAPITAPYVCITRCEIWLEINFNILLQNAVCLELNRSSFSYIAFPADNKYYAFRKIVRLIGERCILLKFLIVEIKASYIQDALSEATLLGHVLFELDHLDMIALRVSVPEKNVDGTESVTVFDLSMMRNKEDDNLIRHDFETVRSKIYEFMERTYFRGDVDFDAIDNDLATAYPMYIGADAIN